MDWIKRNLLFVIGATVALLLMVGAGFYTWSGWSQNSKALDDLNAKYEELKRLTNLNPNPGSGKVDNIKAAREQQQKVRGVVAQASQQFEAIPAIPEGANVSVEAFANGLSRTIFILQREATNAGITLTPKYSFSFQQQSSLMKFSPGSVGPLAVQLGEVKALCDVLIAAKINSLESIQRERVSADDQAGQQTDYLDLKSETNALGVLTPYQITFRSFTPELAAVLCGFARSPNGIIVKSFNLEPAPATAAEATPTPVMTYIPSPLAAPTPQYGKDSARDAFRSRYGSRYGIGPPGLPPPTYTPPPVAVPVARPVSSAPHVVLDERQLKVTMLVQVVKLKK